MTDMTAEQALPDPKDALAYLIHRIEPGKNIHSANNVERAIASLRQTLTAPRVPDGWKHDCAGILTNDVELWIDACPHCGKPRPTSAQSPAEPAQDELACPERNSYDKVIADQDAVIAELRSGIDYWCDQYKQLAEIGDKAMTESSEEIAELRERVKVLESAFDTLLEEYDDRKAQFGDEFLWHKHEDKHGIEQAKAARLREGGDQ